jgi:hypothetical protein
MNHCPECGGRVTADFNACPACGKNLDAARAISRLNVKRDKIAAAVQKPLSEQVGQMDTGIVTNKASTEYGMAARGHIWQEGGKSGAAPPPAQKARRSAPEPAVAEPGVESYEPPAPRARTSGGIREVGEDEEVALAGAASGAEAYTCYRCGAALRYIPEYGRWYCDSCYSYV